MKNNEKICTAERKRELSSHFLFFFIKKAKKKEAQPCYYMVIVNGRPPFSFPFLFCFFCMPVSRHAYSIPYFFSFCILFFFFSAKKAFLFSRFSQKKALQKQCFFFLPYFSYFSLKKKKRKENDRNGHRI